MYKLFVLGLADAELTREQQTILAECSLLVGATRFAPLVAHLPGRFLAITPLAAAFTAIRAALQQSNVAVLVGGDPLFYGIGRRLLAEFPQDSVRIYPALSSMQRACALFQIPWDDAAIISLHGRTRSHIPGVVLNHEKNLLFTDAANSPDKIAGQLLDYLELIGETVLPATIEMLVAEDIGLSTENLFCGTLLEGCRQRFSPLNILCLLIPSAPESSSSRYPYRFGLSEESIQHSRGLITKNEVRAASLHQLQLPSTGIFWDIGAGSGSLSIEAARANPELTVYAIEHKEEELNNIKNNIVKFRCYNIVPVFGRAPQALANLPPPDRVFIGGSSGSLGEIIALLDRRLDRAGRLVINGVIDRTVQLAPQLMHRHGFSVATSVIKVTRTEPDGRTLDFNPITIMTGTR
ncbi:precorrin-6y C5,15-methyltransferase (decarboxylating) subunit CbiE [Desulfocastanea catecholica]